MRNLALIVLSPLLTGLALSQAPSPAAGVTIGGKVIQSESGAAIPDAEVTLTRIGTVSGRVILPWKFSTDKEGRFLFEQVASGEYQLRISAKGYAVPDSASSSGVPVRITSDSVSGLEFRLVKAGVINGNVYSTTGLPLANIRVQLLRPSYDALGKRSYFVAGSAATDDRGRYRLFDVAPGRYHLAATDTLSSATYVDITSADDPPAANIVPFRYTPIYYLAAASLADASTIEMTPGMEMTGIDFRLTASSTSRIFGAVLDAVTGLPPERTVRVLGGRGQTSLRPAVRFRIFSRSGETGVDSATFTYPDLTAAMLYADQDFAVSPEGTFELINLLPGRYWLLAVGNSSSTVGNGLSALVPLDLSSGNAENIQMRLSPGVTVRGRIELENVSGKEGQIPEKFRIQLRPLFIGQRPHDAMMDAAGVFTFNDVTPGEYRVEVMNLSPGFYIKSIPYAGREGLTDSLVITGQTPLPIPMVLSQRIGRAGGVVSNEGGGSVAGARVVLIPDGLSNRTDLYRETTSDAMGHYQFRQAVPGDYTVFAWTGLEGYPYFDADFVRALQASGKPVRITESTSAEIHVTVITPVQRR